MATAETNDNWVERLSGDEIERDRAIAELHELLMRGLTKSLSTRYGTGVPAEDVVQEAIIKILASLEMFEGRSRFTTWAMTIATRVGISELRRRHYKDVSLNSMTTSENMAVEIALANETPVDANLDRPLLLAKLKHLIENELTEKQRAATQGMLDGLPIEEIARRTGSNRNAVYKLVHDARMRLRDGFAASGIMADDVNSIIA